MSSVAGAFSQVAPFKRYIATGLNTNDASKSHIYDIAGANGAPLLLNTVLRDMGKTVYLNGANYNVLRKVQYLPVSNASTSLQTGYIYISGVAPSDQRIVELN